MFYKTDTIIDCYLGQYGRVVEIKFKKINSSTAAHDTNRQ